MAILKVAKPGGSIDDAEKNLVMTSERSCMIEFASGSDSVTTSGGSATKNISNQLGYFADYFIFVRDPDNTDRWFPINNEISLNVDVFSDVGKYVESHLTTSNLVLRIYQGSEIGDKTYNFFYIIHANRPDNAVGTGNSNVSGKLRIAKDGYNAETETDARNMKFFSGKNVPKVDVNLSGNNSLTVSARVDEFTYRLGSVAINNNLGYVPVCYVVDSSNGAMFPAVGIPRDGEDLILNYYITSTQLVITAINPADFSQTVNFKYKILRDKII